MNIEINIPANDYVQPTEVRENVVQAICDAFLETHCWSIYHPFRDGRGRNPTCLVVPKNGRSRASFEQEDRDSTKTGIKFNGAEMKAAFSVLRKAGYHIFRVYEYGSWLGYEKYLSSAGFEGIEVSSLEEGVAMLPETVRTSLSHPEFFIYLYAVPV